MNENNENENIIFSNDEIILEQLLYFYSKSI